MLKLLEAVVLPASQQRSPAPRSSGAAEIAVRSSITLDNMQFNAVWRKSVQVVAAHLGL